MNPSVGKKLSIFVATIVLLVTGAMGYVSYRMMEGRFANILRGDTLDAAALLSSRVRNELRHVAEKGRFLTAVALEDFRNPEDQGRFLQENMTIDDQFVAMTLFRRSVASQGAWVPVFRLTRPVGDPAHLSDEDFKMLDLRFPLDLKQSARGDVDVAVGGLRDGTPLLRMAVPIVRKKGAGFTQILEMEIRQERITAAFADSTAHFSFILDRHGRVIAQTDPTHFTLGEDLSHLPILQMARATEAPNGNLDYYEVPGASLQYGSFHKVGYADLTVVTQAPQSQVIGMLREYTRQSGFMGLACLFLAAALTLLACWGIIGFRLRRIGRALEKMRGANFAQKIPESGGEDEIGEFARVLQSVCDEMDAREKVHGTFAKLNGRRAKELMTDGKLALKGARGKAYVLHCQMGDLNALTADGDPEVCVALLNEFTQKICALIEAQGGVVDHVHAGAIVAFWGFPVTGEDDADRVFYTTLQIREIGRAMADTLHKKHFPAVKLTMGLAYGKVVGGELGSDNRREYTLVGEASELASKIHTNTEQLGTDVVVTGDAAHTAPEWYSLEQVSPADDSHPELFELVSSARQGTLPPVDQDLEAEESDSPFAAPVTPERFAETAEIVAEAPEEASSEAMSAETSAEPEPSVTDAPADETDAPADEEAERFRKRKSRKLKVVDEDVKTDAKNDPKTGSNDGQAA